MKLKSLFILMVLGSICFVYTSTCFGSEHDRILAVIDSLEFQKRLLDAEIARIQTAIDSLKAELLKADGSDTSLVIRHGITNWQTPLRDRPTGKRIKMIPKGTKVELLRTDGNYWIVRHDGQTGYVLHTYLELDDASNKYFVEQRDMLKRKLFKAKRDIESQRLWIQARPTGNLRSEPSTTSNVIDTIRYRSSVYVQRDSIGWYLVYYSDGIVDATSCNSIEELEKMYKSGWIHSSIVSEQLPTNESFYKAEAAQKEKQKEEQQRRQAYIKHNPQINQQFRDAILHGKVILGMTRSMVVASWGEPIEVNRSVGSWGVHEQWVYMRYQKDVYVYLENDVVTSFQD